MYRPSALGCTVFFTLAVMASAASADPFEEEMKQALTRLRATLDDRLVLSYAKRMQDSVAEIQDQYRALDQVPPTHARPSETTVKAVMAKLESGSKKVLDACDSQRGPITERLRQAQRRETDLINTYPATFSDGAQRTSYWKARTRLESYKLLLNHVADVVQLTLGGLDAYIATMKLVEKAPIWFISDIEGLAQSVLDGIKAGCREYAFVQEVYDTVQRQ